MLELPEKFKSALGNGVRTSLFPVIRFYKDVRIDDSDTWSAAESVNLSIKETNLDGIAFDPLLLNAPSIKSSADVINNKYTISSVSLSISNAPYKGEIFSDDVRSLLNSVCQVYYCANGLNSLDDCLLVYTGTVRRFNQSAESIKLELEDLTEQMLSTQIPASLIPDDGFYREEDTGKPYPMVYGYVDKSPLILKSTGLDDMGELENVLSNLYIDKTNRHVRGLWETPNSQNYGHEFLNDGHPLIENGYIKSIGALSIYSEGFVPLPRDLNMTGWVFYVGGITNSNDDDYNPVHITGNILYNFSQANSDNPASITINSNALIDEEEIQGLPTRIYRPISAIDCFTFCDNDQGPDVDAINRIYGFTGYDIDDFNPSGWTPWNQSENITTETTAYDNNWSSGDATWWEPTEANNNVNGGKSWNKDENWGNETFPVERLQNGLTSDGIYLCGRNPDGVRTDGDNKSGGAYVRMKFKDNVGSFPCSTKMIYDAEYHLFANMDPGNQQWIDDNSKLGYWAEFWQTPDLIEAGTDREGEWHIDNFDYPGDFPFIPNDDFTVTSSKGNGSAYIINGYGESNSFNNTTAFDSTNFGIPQYHKQGQTAGNDVGYIGTQLFNAYTLHDSVVDNPMTRGFYADVVGRTYAPFDLEGIITSADTIVVPFPAPFPDIILTFFNVSDKDLLQSWIDEYGQGILSKVEIENTSDYFNGTYSLNFDYDMGALRMTDFSYDDVEEASWTGEGNYTVEARNPIAKSENIMEDILKDELNYNGNITMPNEYNDWMHSFTLNEQKEAKEVFEGLFKSSLVIPSFDAQGQFKFLDLRQTIDTTAGLPVVNNEDIIKYSFELSKIDDVKNQVNVKYKKNYASGDFDEETGYSLIDADDNDHETYDAITKAIYPNTPSNHYSIDYYGLTSDEAKLEVETEYIRDELTARKLQKRLVSWYANQHLMTKIDLPVKYMDLEVGDYIKFDELLGGKLAFGYDYTRSINKNGQLVYPVFFITKISKSLQKVSIESIQVHRGEYGFPEIIID